MIDFTSALYLGFSHASHELPAWEHLTLGKPAALETPELARHVGHKLARLIGCEAGIMAPSTLHVCLGFIWAFGYTRC